MSIRTALAVYDAKALTKVFTDVSSYGLEAVLLQETDNSRDHLEARCICVKICEPNRTAICASRKKEALAVTWACEKILRFPDWFSII